MQQFLTLDQVQIIAPSVFSTNRDPNHTDESRYTFISTIDLLAPMLNDGWGITSAEQTAARKNQQYTRHLIRLREKSITPIVDDTFPEIIITNSHNGKSNLEIHGGLFRLICSNGMVIPEGDSHKSKFRHVGRRVDLLDAVSDTMAFISHTVRAIPEMSQVELDEQRRLRFAYEAAGIVYDDPSWDTGQLLQARRVADVGNDAWRVFNRVQENLTKGGMVISRSAGDERRPSRTRRIKNIAKNIDVNMRLWELAENLIYA